MAMYSAKCGKICNSHGFFYVIENFERFELMNPRLVKMMHLYCFLGIYSNLSDLSRRTQVQRKYVTIMINGMYTGWPIIIAEIILFYDLKSLFNGESAIQFINFGPEISVAERKGFGIQS